jgi:hypothetical protein
MKDSLATPGRSIQAVAPPPLPIEQLLVGKPVQEVATLLPRVFTLCRAAQEVAAARALGLEETGADISAELTRDHLLKLFVSWPGFFGHAAAITPAMLRDPKAAIASVFGPAGLPHTPDDMDAFLASGHGVAPLLRRISDAFGSGEATANDLPLVCATDPLQSGAAENSAAGRRSTHPALARTERAHGRGPLWRSLGRAVDLAMVLEGDRPEPQTTQCGTALVPATRGRYAVQATVEDGHVTAFKRITPTDHMTAPGGMLDLTLASLPADKCALAPLLLDILDPCSPVRLEYRRQG